MMNSVSLKNVCKSYKNFSLDNVTFDVPKGSIVGLIGENGAGKTTLLRAILGSIALTGGEIELLGETDRKKFCALRQKIGVVPDGISFPDAFKVKNIEKMLGYVFDEWDTKTFYSYIERFEVPVNKKFSDLSLGTKKKIGIAAALSHNADLLILDEATSGLDPVVRNDLLDVLFEFTRNEEHTVIFSSHIVSDLEKLCDYIAALHKGKLIFCREKDELLEDYRLVQCTNEALSAIPAEKTLGRRTTPYGAKVVMKREDVPRGFQSEQLSVEDLFVYISKEGTKDESTAV